MLLIGGNWERVETKADCLRVIREQMGAEFADKAESILLPSVGDSVKELIQQIGDVLTAANDVQNNAISILNDIE